MHDPVNQNSSPEMSAASLDSLTSLKTPSSFNPLNLFRQSRNERLIKSLVILSEHVQRLSDRVSSSFDPLHAESKEIRCDLFGAEVILAAEQKSTSLPPLEELTKKIDPDIAEDVWEFLLDQSELISFSHTKAISCHRDFELSGRLLLEGLGVTMPWGATPTQNVEAVLKDRVSALGVREFNTVCKELSELSKQLTAISKQFAIAKKGIEEMRAYASYVQEFGEIPHELESYKDHSPFNKHMSAAEIDELAGEIVELLEEADKASTSFDKLEGRLKSFTFFGRKVMDSQDTDEHPVTNAPTAFELPPKNQG